MSYSHDVEADFAASELAAMFAGNPALCYAGVAAPPAISASAGHEPSASNWPKADGLISILEAGGNLRAVALEYKRPQEGIHGLLTALGQAQAYLHKGYNGAALVVPKCYPTLENSCAYAASVLTTNGVRAAIGVFGYDTPDTSSSTPFRGRLDCTRALSVEQVETALSTASARTHTQWVHMREGSTTRDAFYRFLQTAKLVSAGAARALPVLPPGLVAAVRRVAPSGVNPWDYLANVSDDNILSRTWKHFWFEWLATPAVLKPWLKRGAKYYVPPAQTRIEKDDGTGLSELWRGRVSSLKNVLVDALNGKSITEQTGWDIFVQGTGRPGVHLSGAAKKTQGVRERAHSYREDLDSSLLQLDLLSADGQLTDTGHHYVTICERYGGANSEAAKEYIGATLLQAGHYGAFLHYLYRLSEERFSVDPLAFTKETPQGKPVFTEGSYWDFLDYIEAKLTSELKVMRKVSKRSASRRRTNFQAELTLLRRYGFVSEDRYRLGVGVPIDWIRVQQAMALEL